MSCPKQNQKLKTIAYKNTRSTILAYGVPSLVYSPLVVLAGLTSYSYWSFVLLYAITIVFILVNMAIIKSLPRVSYELGAVLLYTQVVFFLVVFLFWIGMLEQGRYGGLFFAFSMLVYTYAYGSRAFAITLNTAVVAGYLVASYYSLTLKGNTAHFRNDILAIAAFLPVNIVIGQVGSRLARRKRTFKALLAEKKITEEKLQDTLTQLEHAATTDELTGLINRREINNRLEYEFKQLGRTHNDMCILILDLDFFKNINDQYGHPMGDIVLKRVASCLSSSFRETDSVSRWGGEEFIVLMPNTSLACAKAVSQRALEALRQLSFPFGEINLSITASGGLCQVNGFTDIECALHLADEHLYKAKESGRNQISCAEVAAPIIS